MRRLPFSRVGIRFLFTLSTTVLTTAVIILVTTSLPSGQALAQQKTAAPPEFIAWLPIAPAEQQSKEPAVEKDAGAEVLFWRVRVVDELLGNNRDLQRVFYHYVRLKIFDEKGKEAAATIDLPASDRHNIVDVSGRTIKPDGSILELDKKTVFKRDLVRAGGRKIKAVSFAMPGVEPGVILEYRWREIEDDNRFRYVELAFSREFPVRLVTYYIKPLPSDILGSDMPMLYAYNGKTSPLKPERDGYMSMFVENIPAFHEEPFAPSEPNVRPWALLVYQEGNRNNADKYWNEVGKKTYQRLKDTAKTDNDLKTATTEAMANAKTDDEKLAGLIAHVRTHVRNAFDRDVTDDERNKLFKALEKDHARTAAEIYKSGIGLSNEMNTVLAAMAQQAGFDARPARVADRNQIIFNPKNMVDDYFVPNVELAIKRGDGWKIYDVSTKRLAPGMISWSEEGMYAMVADPKASTFIPTPASPPEASLENRKAKLELTNQGTLQGDVEETYGGHRAEDYRRTLDRQNQAQRDQWLQDRVTRMFPDAQVTQVKVENVDDPAKPMRVTYHLEADHFAQVTGKRILFQPNSFRRSQGSPFSAAKRRYDIFFPYAWKEVDDIAIRLPMGWSLDNPQSPTGLDFGKPGSYAIEMSIAKSPSMGSELITHREFTFGKEGALMFGAETYPTMKKIFDQVQVGDRYSISIKQD